MRVQIKRVMVEGRSVYQLTPWRQESVLFSNPSRTECISHARKNGWQVVST
jgi:hypothetical protein